VSVDRQTTLQEVRSIMAEVFNLPEAEIPADVSFGDFTPWDSLSHMDLLMTLEDRCGLALDAETISELTSLDAILRALPEMPDA